MDIALIAQSPPPAIWIDPPASAAEWRQARALILDHLTWVRTTTGIDVFERQDDARDELAQLERWYVPPRGALLVARLRGAVVGTLGVLVQAPGVGELRRLYVRPEARGHQLGERLVASAIQWAARLGCERLRLETIRGAMDAAIEIYERFGFQSTTFEGIHDHPDLLRMVRPVLSPC